MSLRLSNLGNGLSQCLIEESTNTYSKTPPVSKKTSTNPDSINPQQLSQTERSVYKLCLSLIIFSITQIQAFKCFFVCVLSSIAWYLDQLKVILKINKSVPENLSIPKSICVILDEDVEKDKLYDLFCLITDVFSSMGVKNLSFYKFQGFPNELQDELRNRFEIKENNNNDVTLKNKNEDSYQNIVQRKVSQKNHEASNENDNIDLKFLSYETSGRGVLVQVCQDIADKQLSEDHEYKVIDKNLINKKILSKTGLQDPELVILIGPNESLNGFSPWHLRLSEIIKIHSYKLTSQRKLFEILIKYSKIEKRLGK